VLLTACSGGDSSDSAASSSASDTTSSSASESSAGGDASSSEFCTQAQAFLDQVRNADLGSQDPAAIGGLLTQAAGQMRAIEPPAEIATDWGALADAIEQLGTAYATTDFNDPQQAATFQQTATKLEAQLSTSSMNVETYLADECGITDANGSTAPSS
jgi:hypothetical protein